MKHGGNMNIVSGIKPTGSLTIGHYVAIKEFIKQQSLLKDDDNLFIFIADLHAITVKIDKKELKKNIKDIAALYVACGLNPKKASIFVQSDVKEHANLGYIMEATSYMGEMQRMTQCKDKKTKQEEGVRTALFTYPCLMAADILLYDCDVVPIGEDQKQHLELTRNLAERFNSTYGETFKIPKAEIAKVGARIKGLQDPLKKMSKTDENPKNYISLLDDVNAAKNKIKSAVTDSEPTIKYDEKHKPGISNLLTIYSVITDKPISEIVKEYENSNYQTFKSDLADLVGGLLTSIQTKYNEIIKDGIDQILLQGAEKASLVARKTLSKVRRRMGLGSDL